MDLDDSAGAMERFFFLHLLLHVLLALDCSTSIILLNPDNDAPLFVHLSNPLLQQEKDIYNYYRSMQMQSCKSNYKRINNVISAPAGVLLDTRKAPRGLVGRAALHSATASQAVHSVW